MAPGQFTLLLKDWKSGNKAALDSLTPIVYQELRQLAGAKLNRERDAHTLQPTALIHEAYLKSRPARPGALAQSRPLFLRRQPPHHARPRRPPSFRRPRASLHVSGKPRSTQRRKTKTKTNVKAGEKTFNHNQVGMAVRSTVKAGGLTFNHNQSR